MSDLFTKGMIAADFLGDPTGTGLDMPSQTHRASGGLTAGSCGRFLFGCNSAHGARRLHGSTKLTGAGRLWTMCCTPSISIVAQSICMAVILPPEMRHSRPAPFRWSSGTSKQGQRIPAEVGGSLTPTAAAMYELVDRHRRPCRRPKRVATSSVAAVLWPA